MNTTTGTPKPTAFRRAVVLLAWALLLTLVVAYALVPTGRPAVAVWLGLQWAMLQLWVLGRSKTLSWNAYGLTFTAGAFLVAPVTMGTTGLVDWVLTYDMDAFDVFLWELKRPTLVAGPVEEVMKLLPLGVLIFIYRRRGRLLSAIDCALVAFASGAGFAFVEDAIRKIDAARPNNGFPGLFGPDAEATNYGFFNLLPGELLALDGSVFAGHHVLTGVVGAAIGLAIHSKRRTFGGLLTCGALAYVAFSHSMFNWSAGAGGQLEYLTSASRVYESMGQGSEVASIFLVLLTAAVVMDYRRIAASGRGLPVVPLGVGLISGLCALRRVMLNNAARPALTVLANAVLHLLRAVCMALQEVIYVLLAARGGLRDAISATSELRERREFGLGRDNPNRRRRLHAATVVGVLVLVGPLVSLADATPASGQAVFLVEYLDALGRWWNSMPWWQQLLVIVAGAALGGFLFGSIGMGIALSSIATGITAHGQGAATFVRSPGSATRSWFENLTPGELLLILGTEAAGRLIPSALSAKLGKNFYKHPNASRLANYSSDTQQRWMHRWPQEMKDAYRKQVDELAPDPDHRRSDGTYSPEGMKYDEGAIATELLWRGEFRDLIRPADAGMGDFLEPVGVKQDGRVLFQAWDIKGFRNEKPGRFTEENVIKNVQEQFDRGRNVILDTSNLSDLDQALLRQWVDQPGWAGRIFWFDWKDSS